MKKRVLSLLLVVLMVVSLLPTMAFAADDFTITNGTPESDKETNHGYIAIDKTSGAEGDAVTVTVNPNEGYELKADSLKVYKTNTVVKSEPQALPITPMQDTQDKTKYTFTMPAYAVVVVAEFEEVGGTPSGKTLPYSFDFETDMVAEGWTNFDADNDGQDWITGTNKYGAQGWGVEGSRCAISQSYENNGNQSFNADNWLFSPAITIPAGGATVSWYEQSQDRDYPDFYEVYICETNTSTDTSKMTEIFSGTAANPWNQRSVELEAAEYAGKTVYIAFRHHSYDCYMLEIDNFAIKATVPPDPCEGYTDIDRGSWYHSAAEFVIERGLMGSTKTDALTFEPNTKVSRAMVASILYRMADSPAVEYKATFTDVPADKWYTTAIEWCAQNGLASGKGDGKFDPMGDVTRQELAVFMMKMAEYLGKDTSGRADLGSFADGTSVPSWAKEYVQWAVSAGLISGKANGGKTYLAPTDTATRAEFASIIMRFVQNIAEAK